MLRSSSLRQTKRAEGENRTLVSGATVPRSTIQLHPPYLYLSMIGIKRLSKLFVNVREILLLGSTLNKIVELIELLLTKSISEIKQQLEKYSIIVGATPNFICCHKNVKNNRFLNLTYTSSLFISQANKTGTPWSNFSFIGFLIFPT